MRDPYELIALRTNIPADEARSADERRTWNSTFRAITDDATEQTRAASTSDDDDDTAPKKMPGEMRLIGYSAVFDSDSELLYGFIREQVKRGAFKNVLKRDDLDVRLLVNHEGAPHARTTNGTLKLEEKPRGLYRDAVLDPRRTDSRDLYYGVERGDFTQSSFAFRIGRSEWRYCEHVEQDDYHGCDCVWERDILEVSDLLDDSVVTYPAYPAATAEVARSSEAEVERHALASDEEQRDTATDADTSPADSVSNPNEKKRRERRARIARIKGFNNESVDYGGTR